MFPQFSRHSLYLCSPPLTLGHCDCHPCCRQPLLLTASPLPHTPLSCSVSPAHLLREAGGGDELQVLQVGVEERVGQQLPANFALDDVPHGAVIRQADEL